MPTKEDKQPSAKSTNGESMSLESQNTQPWTVSNTITLIRIALVPVFVAALLAPWPVWFGLSTGLTIADEKIVFSLWDKRLVAAAIFIIISATDWLDGYLARSRHEITDFGKFMDPLADKILVAAALISLVELGALPTWVVLVILAREFIVSGVRMMAAGEGVVIAASPLGKAKTVFQMIAIVLFVVKDSYLTGQLYDAIHDTLWLVSWAVMLIALALTLWSLIDYLWKAKGLFGFSKASTTANDTAASLAQNLVALAAEKNLTVGTAESLTGGMIGEAITSVSGSSAVYAGGIISYTNEIKAAELKVSKEILEVYGAVSEECAKAMALGARKALGVDFALSVTGVAGPTGGTKETPVGTVWMGIASSSGCSAEVLQLQGNREEVRQQTTAKALAALTAALEAA